MGVMSLLPSKQQPKRPSACGGRVTFLCWPKSNQKKWPSSTISPTSERLRGLSDSPSMARSENGAHPVRRPSGLVAEYCSTEDPCLHQVFLPSRLRERVGVRPSAAQAQELMLLLPR